MKTYTYPVLAAFLASTALASTAALAQTTDTNPQVAPEMGEIVVTAQRRAESIQDTPVSVTAFSNESLREQNISSAQDLLGKVPSVIVGPNGTQRDAESITLRGQGQTFGAPVGVVNYFAEVPLIQGSVLGDQGGPGLFFDLESLQVLRGPQGTLFGRNTTGGALLVGPKRPTQNFEGYIQGQYGNYNDREFEGAINIPVVPDILSIRIGGKYAKRDGFTKDVGPEAFGFTDICVASTVGCLAPAGRGPGFAGKRYDDRDYWTARIGILFTPTDGVENYLVAYKTKSDTNGTGTYLEASNGNNANLAGLAANLAYLRPFVPAQSFNPAIIQGILARQRELGPRKVALNTDTFFKVDITSVTDILSVRLNDALTFRNIFGYQRMKQSFAWDLDGSIAPILANIPAVVTPGFAAQYPELGAAGSSYQATNLSLITEEPQIQGKMLDGKLDFVFGGFLSHTKPEGFQGTGSFNVGNLGGTFAKIDTRSTAVYFQATLDLGTFSPALDNLKLTGGYRHTWDTIKGSRIAPAFVVIPTASAKLDTNAPTWTIGLDYQPNRDLLLFGRVTRGYKSGGFNASGPRVEVLTFQPEYVTNYEIGVKSDFRIADMPVRLNVSAYNLDYKDIQRATADNAPNGLPPPASGFDSGSRVFNAESARIRGIEVEGVIRPVTGLELSGSYAYTDAKYKKYTLIVAGDPRIRFKDSCDGPVALPASPGQTVALDMSCLPFQHTPKHQFNLNARYSMPLGDDVGTLVANAGYSWVGTKYSLPVSTIRDEPDAKIDSFGLLNLSLDWNGLFGSNFDARFFMTNVTNKLYRISSTSASSAGTGFTASIYGEPRMYGTSLRYHF